MSTLTFNEQGAPTTPAANKGTVYFDSADERMKLLDDQGQTFNISSSGMRNWNVLVNGDFQFAQRQVWTTLTSLAATTTRTYRFDRWAVSNETTSLQTAGVDNSALAEAGLSAASYGQIKQITNAGKFTLSQAVEWANCGHLMGRTVIFQFKAKQSAGTGAVLRFSVNYLNSSGTTDTITAAYTTAWGANGTDPTWATNHVGLAPTIVGANDAAITGLAGTTNALTSSWVQHYGIFTIPASAKNIIPIIWAHNQLATNDVINLSEVGLYDGQEVRDWYARSPEAEFALCSRYYYKTFNVLIAPADGANNGYQASIVGKAGATALGVVIGCRYPVRLRTSPTPVLFSPGASGAAVPYRLNGTTPAPQTTAVIVAASEWGFTVTATGDANGAVGDHVGVHFTADAEL